MRLLVVALGVLILCAGDVGAQKVLEQYGISLRPPPNWHTAPDALIDGMERSARELTGSNVDYVAGFKPTPGDDWSVLPYVLVQVISAPGIPREDYLRAVVGPEYSAQRSAINQSLSQAVGELSFDSPSWDPTTDLVWSRFRAARPDGTPFQGISVQRLYERGILLVHYYLSPADPVEAAAAVAEGVILGAGTTAVGRPPSQIDAEVFVRVALPQGVSLEIPRNWIVLSDNRRILIDSSTRAGLDLSDVPFGTSVLPFAANLYDDDGRTLALVNVRYYPDSQLTQQDALAFTPEDVGTLDEILEDQVRRGMDVAGIEMISWDGTTAQPVNGLRTFVSEYHRRSVRDGSVGRVRLVRVLLGARSFTTTVSYSEEDAFLLKPIIDRIVASISAGPR